MEEEPSKSESLECNVKLHVSVNVAFAMRRPRSRFLTRDDSTYVMVLEKRNYEVYADIGIFPGTLFRKLRIFDTGAGPTFIRSANLPPVSPIQPPALTSIADANCRPLRTSDMTELTLRLGNHMRKVQFVV